MLHFPEDQYWASKKTRKEHISRRKSNIYNPQWIPTADEVEEFNAALYSDIIKQIKTGQGINWGYETERHVENNLSFPSYDKIEENQKRTKAKRAALRSAIKALKVKAPRTPRARVRVYKKHIHKPSQRVIEGLVWLMGCSKSKALGLILVAPNPSLQYKMVKEHIHQLDLEEKENHD